jgi:Domain of unknown function (DUF5615)
LRLFLDAHISDRKIAGALRRDGHDVRSAAAQRALDGMTDEELLALAAGEGRIFVTCDVADFPDVARKWSELGRHHAGLAILVGMDHGEFGELLRALRRALSSRPDPSDWSDVTLFVSRTGR